MPLTKPDARTEPTASQSASSSNPAASVPHTQVVDDDGWVVQSASQQTVTAEELKARAESVKVPDQKGRRDLRPGAKDAPDAAAAAATLDPEKKKLSDAAPDPWSRKPAAAALPEDDADLEAADDGGDAEDADIEAASDEEPPPPAADAKPADAEADPDAPEPRREERRPSRRERRLNRIQDDIDRETKRKYDLQRENDDLERRLRDRRTGDDADPDRAVERRGSERRERAPAEDAKPTWDAYREAGKSWDTYTDDRDAWAKRDFDRHASATLTEGQRAQKEHEDGQRRAAAFADSVAKARTTHDDFDDAIADLESTDNTPFIQHFIAQDRDGGELMYYLGRRPNMADRLSELTLPRDGRPTDRPDPRHRPILEVLRDSTNPTRLLRKLLEGNNFRKVEGLPVAKAFKALYELEASLPAPKQPGSAAGGGKKQPAPPLRPPAGATVAGSASRAGDRAEADEPFEQFVQKENTADRQRGRR